MKQTPESIKAKLTNILELPPDAVMDLPRYMLVSNTSLLVENHQGILEYGEMLIRVATKDGPVRIEGEGLELEELSTEEIMISGQIDALKWTD